jgi:peptidoglycan-N-acetylglucosamine deacetylase
MVPITHSQPGELVVLKQTLVLSCLIIGNSWASQEPAQPQQLVIHDQSRNRSIPVALYVSDTQDRSRPVIILNHGYGAKHTDYSFLANPVAKQGYTVVSIQHDLPGDPTLPREGNIFKRRYPLWERGVQNIQYVLSDLKQRKPDLNVSKIILIGHSNGGDISMLFATQHPDQVAKVISLDSLRHPFPTKDRLPILSFRATDTKADPGVLPESGATIIPLNARHIDMHDKGSPIVKKEIVKLCSEFLKG